MKTTNREATKRFSFILIGAALALARCAGADGGAFLADEAALIAALPAEGSPPAVGALVAVNDCATTLAVLDVEARLYSGAARALVTARDGGDGVCGTADDFRFAQLADLLAVRGVGAANVARLVAWAGVAGFVPEHRGGTVEGVGFTDAEADATLAAANSATLIVLDRQAGLRSDAALAIVLSRPHGSLWALASVRGVGAGTLELLKAFACPPASAPVTEQPAAAAPEPALAAEPAPDEGSFLLDADALDGILQSLREGLWEDEGFVWEVVRLASGDEELFQRIMSALEAELARAGAALVGRRYADRDAARDAVADAAAVKSNVRNSGWAYLSSLGVTR